MDTSEPFRLDDGLASRWFGLRAEYEKKSFARRASAVVWQVFLGLITLGLSLVTYDPKRFCDVIVYRRQDDFPVAHFSYKTLEPANEHLVQLRQRLDETPVGQFCRELEIPVHYATGPGVDVALTEIDWIGIRSDNRRRYWPTVN